MATLTARALLSALAFTCASLLTAEVRAGEELEVSIAYVPADGVEAIEIDQPLGKLTIRAWPENGKDGETPPAGRQIKIVAKKRAPSSVGLDRLKVNVELAGKTMRVRSGVRSDKEFRSLPPSSAKEPMWKEQLGVDLTIEAPREVALKARTWAGDIDASGFRAGAQLTSSGGEVHASDLSGPVHTSALSGRQELRAIHGDVEADGVSGDLDLVAIDGTLLVARVVDGKITAREVRSPTVRLYSTSGGVVLVGSLRLGARWEAASHGGDVRVLLTPASPFSLTARAPHVRSQLQLDGAPSEAAGSLAGSYRGGGAALVLASDRGNVSVEPAP